MKSGRIFWGVLLIILGVLGILYNYFDIHLSWDILWKLWPLLLVFLGISAFIKDSRSRWIVVAGVGLLTAVVIFSSVQKGCSSIDRIIEVAEDDSGRVFDSIDQRLSIGYDSSVAAARFAFEGGAGRFEIVDTTTEFVRAETESNISGYRLEQTSFGDIPRISLGMEEESVSWEGDDLRNHVRMYLNPEPHWDLDIDAGAAKIDFDLRPFLVRKLSLETGATSMRIRLGSRADTCHVHVETGASSLTMHVPGDVGCEVRMESALSRRELNGFDKLSSGHYRSPNFDAAPRKIFIHIESGLSKIRIDRESAPDWEM